MRAAEMAAMSQLTSLYFIRELIALTGGKKHDGDNCGYANKVPYGLLEAHVGCCMMPAIFNVSVNLIFIMTRGTNVSFGIFFLP